MTTNKPLVFLHGWGTDKNCFSNLVDQLKNQGQIVLFDLPGFGTSPLPKRPWGTMDYANYVKSFLDRENISQAIFIGYSFGGRLAIRLAVHYPELVKGIVLIASAGLRKKFNLKRYVRKLLKIGSRDYLVAGPLRPTLVKVVNEDLTQDLTKVKAPCLLIWGEDDKEIPLWIGERMRKLIPKATLIKLPGTDHYSILSLAASQVSFQIIKFLKGLNKNLASREPCFSLRSK